MTLTDYHAKYFAHELAKRCPSDSVEKLASAVAGAQVDLELLQAWRWNEPALILFGRSAVALHQMLRLPELAGARLAEFIERTNPNHGFQFFVGLSHASEEVSRTSAQLT